MHSTLQLLAASAILTALQVSSAAAHLEPKADQEKCYGVAKAGKNDCTVAGGKHSCAGQAKQDHAPEEWVIVPKGLCKKLVRGSLTPPDSKKP